jgi:hypothetical protein
MTDLAEKLKEALEKGRSGQFVRENPYERLGLKENPFHPKFNPNNEDVFIVREDVLHHSLPSSPYSRIIRLW